MTADTSDGRQPGSDTTAVGETRPGVHAPPDGPAQPDGPSDAELITATRSGDQAAFGVLYSRHLPAARRLGLALTRNPSDTDDVVAEAFAKLLSALRDGGGPDIAFRAYLLTSVRNTFYDRTRRNRKIDLTDDMEAHDPGVPFVDTAVEGLERSLAARAFARLPERWQMVLWHTEVEGESPADIAPLLGLTPNGVSALAYRARERLRQAYLQEHLADTAERECQWTAERLGAYVRGGLSNREKTRAEAHLAGCGRCPTLLAELTEVNSGMRSVLAPLVLGSTAAAAYLSELPPVIGTATAWVPGLLGWVGGGIAKLTPTNVATATGAAATGVAVVVGGTLLIGDDAAPSAPPVSAPPSASAAAIRSPAPAVAGIQVATGTAGPLRRGRRGAVTISVTNTGQGSGALPGSGPLSVLVELPGGLGLAPGRVGGGWSCTATPSGADCRGPTTGAGATRSFTLPVTVAPDAVDGTLVTTASGPNVALGSHRLAIRVS